MGLLRQRLLHALGMVSWNVSSRRTRLLQNFSQVERGSYYDMLAAAELTQSGPLRREYFFHALDEGRHAVLFRARAKALATLSRDEAALDEAGYLGEHGIVTESYLFEQMDEPTFLAFVTLSETDAVEQFRVYVDKELPDEETLVMLRDILQDEENHVTYTLDALKSLGNEDISKLFRDMRWKLRKEAWLRFANVIGLKVSGIWLGLIYLLVVTPFRLFGRLSKGGWRAPAPDSRSAIAQARSPA